MFKTDKVGHGYLPTYLDLAAQIGTNGNILEIGVLFGQSLVLWKHLFPEGTIVGIDINPGACWIDDTVKIVTSQTDASIPEKIKDKCGIEQFDLIVDDASHDNNLSEATFENLWKLVKPGRWYVAEDWNHMNGTMSSFAKLLVDCFKESGPYMDDVESITYRHGMIIIQKRR